MAYIKDMRHAVEECAGGASMCANHSELFFFSLDFFMSFSHPFLPLYHLQYSTIGFLGTPINKCAPELKSGGWKTYFSVTTAPYLELSAMHPETWPIHMKISCAKK